MATHVTVDNSGSGAREGATQFSSQYHGMMGEVVGYAITGEEGAGERVLVALESGKLVSFAPSELRAGVTKYTRQP